MYLECDLLFITIISFFSSDKLHTQCSVIELFVLHIHQSTKKVET